MPHIVGSIIYKIKPRQRIVLLIIIDRDNFKTNWNNFKIKLITTLNLSHISVSSNPLYLHILSISQKSEYPNVTREGELSLRSELSAILDSKTSPMQIVLYS